MPEKKSPKVSITSKKVKKKSFAGIKRKPLYPGAGAAGSAPSNSKKQQAESAKSTISIKGNFVRASRLSQIPGPSPEEELRKSGKSEKSFVSSNLALSTQDQSPARSASYSSQQQDQEDDRSEEDESTQESEEEEESYYSKSPSPEPEEEESLSHKSPVFEAERSRPRPPTSFRTETRLGSAGSSQKSPSLGSPRSFISTRSRNPDSESLDEEDQRPQSNGSNMSFMRQSLGQDILQNARRSSSGNNSSSRATAEDYVQSFSQDEASHNMTVTSQGHGVDNNDFYNRTATATTASASGGGGRLHSQGSLFSYKLASDSPEHGPRQTKT